jgi:circadian clock protein KaiC
MKKPLKEICPVERLKSGIKGLDRLIDGGFPKGHSILICGSPGTGKTILGTQFLYKGATDYNQNGLFVSVEDHPERIVSYAACFGWDLEGLHKAGKIGFMKIPIDQKGFKIVHAISKEAKKIKAERIIIDSLSSLTISAKMFSLPLKDQPDPTGTISKTKILSVAGFSPFEDTRQFTHLLVNRISDLKATTLFLTDSKPGSEYLTRDTVSEYVCDGVIHLQLHDTSKNVNRTISVKKMRGGAIIPGLNLLKFTKSGLEVGEFKAFY